MNNPPAIICNNIAFESPAWALNYIHGRISGLASTTRYDMPDGLPEELQEIAKFVSDLAEN